MEEFFTIEHLDEVISDLPIGSKDDYPPYCENSLAYGEARETITKYASIFNQEHDTGNFKIAAYQSLSTKPIGSLLTMLQSALLIKICKKGKASFSKHISTLDPEEVKPFETNQLSISYNSKQSMYVTSEEENSDYLLIILNRDYLYRIREKHPMLYGYFRRLEEDHLFSKYFPIQKMCKILIETEEEIRACSVEENEDLNLKLDSLIHKFLTTLEDRLKEEHTTALITNHFLESNFMDLGKITFHQMVTLVKYCRSTIEEKYLRLFTSTPPIEVKKLRLEEAIHKLLKKQEKIKDIAEDLGIAQSGNLSRDIKKYVGLTPSELISHYNILL